jgi:hypothetical protein
MVRVTSAADRPSLSTEKTMTVSPERGVAQHRVQTRAHPLAESDNLSVNTRRGSTPAAFNAASCPSRFCSTVPAVA